MSDIVRAAIDSALTPQRLALLREYVSGDWVCECGESCDCADVRLAEETTRALIADHELRGSVRTTVKPTPGNIAGAISFLRGAFNNDGAEGESVYLICLVAEDATGDINDLRAMLESKDVTIERMSKSLAFLGSILNGVERVIETNTKRLPAEFAGALSDLVERVNRYEAWRATR